MATYGTGNLVGYAPGVYEDIPPQRRSLLPSAGLGAVARVNLKRAIVPNVAGHIRRADQAITDIDRKVELEGRYKRPSKAAYQNLAEQRTRAVANASYVRSNIHRLHTPVKRFKRAGIGLAALAGAAALFPRKRRTDVPMG